MRNAKKCRACGIPLSKGQRIWTLLCWKTRPWCQNGWEGWLGGRWWLQCTQRISKHWAPCQGSLWYKAATATAFKVFIKVNIFIPTKTEHCCSFLLTFRTSCPVCPPLARIDAVVRTSKRRVSLGFLPPRSRGTIGIIHHFRPRRSLRNGDTLYVSLPKNVLLIPSTRR